MFAFEMSSRKLAMAMTAIALGLGVSLSAQATSVSPGGAITLTGPLSISLSSSPTYKGQTQSTSCTLTINGMMAGTGDITVTSASVNYDCGVGTQAHFYIDNSQFPRTFSVDSSTGGSVIYNSSLAIKSVQWVGFGPQRPVTCFAPFPNLLWYANLTNPAPSDQVRATGGVTFGNASDGGTCLAGGLLTASPAQTFYP
ncbi:hypothetical protein [Dyella choica]|uniref:Protein activator of alkane oxidation PraB n=1 Tax=Dyella choica TaxID=1927959 RepID=A0A3S0WY91_9GAMM|nr:hypothetical protein [Dyella choica]RUL78959.1 hypothetical protein EKH80_03935 [Dyella choica]